MDKDTLLLVAVGGLALFVVMRSQAPAQQQPIIIQQPQQSTPPPERGGVFENIASGIGQVIDGIVTVTK